MRNIEDRPEEHVNGSRSGMTSGDFGQQESTFRLSTGIVGLDEVLCGGLVGRRAYLLRGGPGSGKTTLGMQFLVAGASKGESCLCITMGEPEAEMRKNAKSVGLDLDSIHFLDLSPGMEFFTQKESYDIFSSSEVERDPITERIKERFEELRPTRVFLDAITQFRFLASNAYQFRKQVLSFLRYMVENGATLVFTSEGSDAHPDDDLQFMSDGIIHLLSIRERRFIRVHKFRGSDFRSETHEMRLTPRGMKVFPHLVPRQYQKEYDLETISSGVPELDELLYGGLERGTISLLTGPSGVGKTTIGLQFMKEAAGRGERSVVYAFEEWKETMLKRCEAVNIPVHTMINNGMLNVVQVEPLHFTPDEFANMVRHEVESNGTRIVMIDSISGYRLSLRGDDLVNHMHALCKYLQNMGVAVLLINEVEMITGDFRITDIGISYLTDNVIFMRYLELNGELRRFIGVLKKRLSDFEKTMREFEISRYGIKVGDPIKKSGLLTGRIVDMERSNQP